MTSRITSLIVLSLALGLTSIAGCAEPGPDIDRTQTNLVDKSIFEGEWFYMRTVQDVSDDALWGISSGFGNTPWPGAVADYDIAAESGIAGRIRWVIDENYLYAYRSYAIIRGSSADEGQEGFLGQPLAIFAIDEHVDVRREYNPSTGEPTNVISEAQDRRWYDRQYVRVDWSTNLVTFGLFGESLEIEELFGIFTREPAGNFIQEGGDSRIPDSWRPQFVRVADDPDYRWASEWPEDQADTVHYMSFVTNEIWTPNFCSAEACGTSLQISIRHSFLRVPPEHQYAVETLPNSDYDRFGILRTDSRTYIRGGQDRNTVGIYCDARAVASCIFDEDCGTGGVCGTGGTCTAGVREDIDDCGAGRTATYGPDGFGTCEGNVDAACSSGACDIGTHLCQGGLTEERSETDFLTFYRLRHNFYEQSLAAADDPRHTDGRCLADWQCDNRYGTVSGDVASTTWAQNLQARLNEQRLEGAPEITLSSQDLMDGSLCDTAAARCTIPLASRPTRRVAYTLSPHFPRHLVRGAFDTAASWNETFMHGNRALHGEPQPSGPRVQCQATEPTEYCYCGAEVTAAEVAADQTCAHRSDFFVPPEARGETNPFRCWVAIVDADGNATQEDDTVHPPNPTDFSDYPADVYRYGFVGDECMLVMHQNDCDVPVGADEAPRACNELGDLRYQFYNYVSGAGSGWCGVMQPVQDPTTGEAIASPINMGGLCLEGIANAPLVFWPVLRGEVPEDTYFSGEHVRGYFSRLGNVHVPVGIASSVDGAQYTPEDLTRPALPIGPAGLNGHLNDLFSTLEPQFRQLARTEEGRLSVFSDRTRDLVGTQMEQRLVEGLGLEALTGLATQNPLQAINAEALGGGRMPSVDGMMEQLSPFRDSFEDTMLADRRREIALAENHICNINQDALYTSRYNQYWANAFRGRDNATAQIRWMQLFQTRIMQHEMGHGLGLEHNFAASYDRDQYHDGYFTRVDEVDGMGDHPYALPVLDEFDCGNDGLCPGDAGWVAPDTGEADTELTANEATAWSVALRAARERRLAAGIGNTQASSLMDYDGDNSMLGGLGRYDKAAIYFNYFNMVEAADVATLPEGERLYEPAGSSLEGLFRSDLTDRQLWTYYRGGDACQVNTDCPYAAGSGALAPTQGIHQRCVRNPRYSNIPVPCDGDRNCICSNFDEDFIDFVEFAEPSYVSDANGDGVADYERIEYLFCSNSRLNDISWCSVFDAGESFQETIDHFRQLWTENYPRSYFRNYRRGFTSGSRASSSMVDATKMYQHLFFRYFYEPEFRRETGPLGFNDQYLASIDAMNWIAEVAQLPDIGSYRLENVRGPDTCHPTNPDAPGNTPDCLYAYNRLGDEMDMPGADISLAPGQGFSHWSRYQDGLYGFFRMERAGVIWDKLIALRALTVRDWGLSFQIDERFFINFYDLFPIEMTELFGGYIEDDDFARAPRVRMEGGEPNIYYVNLLRGNCRNATTGAFEPCVGPVQERFPDPPLMGTSNEILRLYAAIWALAEFPVYYDPSFESRLAVYKLDSADGFTIPCVQQDGQPTAGFGGTIPGQACHVSTTDPLDADYIMYISDRLHTAYVATKIRERLTFNLEEEQLGFQLLVRLHETQASVRALEALGTLTPEQRAELSQLRRQIQRGETFLESLIEVQNIFGITSFF
ncbi:MAG: zinc-dependent metalloprotease [Sandaracinaceae bacterium]